MGLLKGPLKRAQTRAEYVYSEDPDVKVPAHRRGCGWFPAKEAIGVGDGADVVTVQGLDTDPRWALRDIRGDHQRHLAAARMGIVDANHVEHDGGKPKAESLMAFIDVLAKDAPTALYMLGLRVLNISDNVDTEAYYVAAREILGVPAKEEPDDGASKSADGTA